MIAMGRGVGFGVLAGRVLGIVAVGGGWLLSAGAGAGMAQPITSSVTFNYFSPPTNTTSLQLDAANNPNNGSVTYIGGGEPINATPFPNDFFTGITGIQFANTPTFNYDASTPGRASLTSIPLFYFLGSCSICGSTSVPPSLSSFISVPNSGANLNVNNIPNFGTQIILSSDPIAIDFGDTGQSGTITFLANNIVNGADSAGLGSTISFGVFQSSKVPGPLPILGASTAFAFSRKLRRRVASANKNTPTIENSVV
jgi:hypothetical protein